MKLRLLLIALLCLTAPASAFWQSRDSNYNVSISTGSGCSQATATIARLDGTQDATHNAAYTTLICNLVTEGVWAKLDVMYVFATNDETNALVNLVQTSYGATKISTPTFAANAGYTGANASTTLAINSNFNPTTATTPNFTQNAAHVSVWSGTNFATTTPGGTAIGLGAGGGVAPVSGIYPRFSDGKAYYFINDGTTSAGITTADSLGFYLANRSNSTTQQGYKNAVNQSVVSQTSGAPQNSTIYVLALDGYFPPAGILHGYGGQVMIATIGGNLSATDVTNLCHEENTYLNTIAGVSSGVC